MTYSIPASDGGTFFSPDDGQAVLNYGNPMNGGVYLDWANDRIDLYKNHTVSIERNYNIYDPILNINAWDSTTASIAEEDGVVDISGEDNHGNLVGGDVSVVTDKILGRCFYFIGTSTKLLNFIETKNSVDIDDSFTICFGIFGYNAGFSKNPNFIDSRSETNPNNFFIAINNSSNRKIRFVTYVNGGTTQYYYSNSELSEYTYYYIVISFEKTTRTLNMYFNGVLDSKQILNSDYIEFNSDRLVFGNFYDAKTDRNFNGLISNVRVFNKVLTAEEVQVIYKQSLVTPYINSNMYEPILNLDADYSTTASIAVADGVIDVSGNHNNGQAYGGVVVNNGTYEFDGTAVKQIVFNTSYPISNNAITLAVKIKHLGRSGHSDGYNVIFGNNIILCYSPAGSICLQLKNNSNANVYRTDSVETSIVDGNTHLLLCIMYIENGTIHFSTYLDNVLQTVSSTTGSTDATVLYNGSGPIVIGELSSVTSYSYMSNMQIFDVKIFDKALNETERYNVYQQSLNPESFENPEKLISYDEINVHHFDNDSLVQDTMFRIGNLSGILGITDNRQGVFIGDENGYIKFDKVNGLRFSNPVISNGHLANETHISGNVYFDNVVGDVVEPSQDNVVTLGSSSKRWKGVYSHYGAFGNISGNPNNCQIETVDISYGRGLRIYKGANGNSGFLLGGNDLTSGTGTSANSWYFSNESGGLLIYKNTTVKLRCDTSGNWTMSGSLTNSSGFVGNVTGHFTNIIGGRNLLRNTGHTAGGNTTTDGTTITIGTENKDTYFNLYNAVALTANKIYTLSFDVNNLQADKSITFRIGSQNNSNFKINVNKNGRIYATGFFTSNINAGAKFILDDITRNLPSTSFTLTNFKLEEGEQATAYSNAWEDVIPNATSAGTCTGNAATSTKTAVTVATGGTHYGIATVPYSATSGTAYGITRLQYANSRSDADLYFDANNASGTQRVLLMLGNQTAITTAAGKTGQIVLWGTGTTQTTIAPANPSSNNTVTLPTGTGTLALTSSNITGSASKWGGYALSIVTALPSSPNSSTIYLVK